MTATLPQIFQQAHVGMHAYEPKYRPDPIVEIAKGLLEMRWAGLLTAVFIDAGVIRIAISRQPRRSITQEQAAKLVKVFRQRRDAI